MLKKEIDLLVAVKRPFADIKNLIIGIIVFSVPIVNLFAPAYFFRCIRGTFKGHSSLPDWRDWKDLFKDWKIMFLLGCIFMALPLGLLWITAKEFLMSLSNVAEKYSELSYTQIGDVLLASFLASKFFMFSTILVILGLYLLFMSYLITNDKKIKKLTYSHLFKKAFHLNYFVAFFGLVIIDLFLYDLLMKIPFIGVGLSEFILGVIFVTIIAQVYTTIP